MSTVVLPQAVSRAEAAKLLDLSLGALDVLIRDGRLRVVRYGRRVLIPLSAVEDFLAGR